MAVTVLRGVGQRGLFQGDFTVVLTTNYFPEWVTKYPNVLVLDEIGIKKNGSSVIAKVRNYER